MRSLEEGLAFVERGDGDAFVAAVEADVVAIEEEALGDAGDVLRRSDLSARSKKIHGDDSSTQHGDVLTRRRCPAPSLWRMIARRRGGRGLGVEAIWLRAVAVACADVVPLHVFADEFDGDGAPAAIGIGLGIVAEGIEMAEVVADRGEGLFLVAPTLGEIGFAAGGCGHALEDGGGDGLESRFARADHVDRNAGGLGEFGDVFGRDHAGVVGAVGEDDDDFAAGIAWRHLLG